MTKTALSSTALKVPRYSMDYQQRYLDDESDNILIEKSRQTGFTDWTARKAVKACIKEGARLDWWIMSKDKDAAKEFIKDCKRWIKVYKIGGVAFGKDIIKGETVFEITFATGVTIHALSSNPNVLVGKRGNVVLDEFAVHDQQQLLLKVSSAVTQWGGQRIVISTHRGKKCVYYTLVQDATRNGNPMGWSFHRVTLQDAVDQGLAERINAATGKNRTREEFIASCRAKCFTEADYLEEYMCVPQDAAGQLIGWDLIQRCTDPSSATIDCNFDELQGDGYLGNDVARKRDLHSYVGLEAWMGLLRTCLVQYQDPSDKSWESRDRKLDGYLKSRKIRRCLIDQTGIGDKYCQDAIKRNGSRVRGVTFTNANKEELAMGVARAMEQGKLILPNHPLLHQHIASITRGYTKTGLVSYDADHSEDGHADLFWGLALAVHGATAQVRAGTVTEETVRGITTSSRRSHTRRVKRRILRKRR